MPAHFLGLTGAATLGTRHFHLTGRIIDDLVAHKAVGVVHGPAGTGKTFAVDFHLERLRERDARIAAYSLAFPSEPTMLRVAAELVRALTGTADLDAFDFPPRFITCSPPPSSMGAPNGTRRSKASTCSPTTS